MAVSSTGSIIDKITRSRVSSVLNKDVKQFGKNHLFDGDEETCWNSDQGKPQWVMVEFNQDIKITEIQIQFQGGFVGKDCWLASSQAAGGDFVKFHSFYPQDINQLQTFRLPQPVSVKILKVVFDSSTDFFGRITIYKLDIFGEVS